MICRLNNGWTIEKSFETNLGDKEVFIEYDNQVLTITQWANQIGIDRSILYNRRRKNWTVERMLTEPKHFLN